MSLKARRLSSVALPIGNPRDISLRAIDALKEADLVFCEDKRKLKFLLNELSLDLKAECQIRSLPGDEEWKADWGKLIPDDCQNIVTLSDAGTPVVNDPGKALTQYAREQGWELVVLPGPSAVTLAIQKSGGFGLPFQFYGFAPRVKSAESKAFKDFLERAEKSSTFIFFDTKYQIRDTLKALVDAGWGNRSLCLLREMTKTYEEDWNGSVSEVAAQLGAHFEKSEQLGELTLVLEGGALEEGENSSEFSIEKLIEFRNAAPRKAAKFLSEHFGLSSQDSYKLIVG